MGFIILPIDTLDQLFIILRLVLLLSVTALVGIFVLRRDLITILICVELFLLSIMIGALSVAGFTGDPIGELFVLVLLLIGAAETALALAIITVFYQTTTITGIDFTGSVTPPVFDSSFSCSRLVKNEN